MAEKFRLNPKSASLCLFPSAALSAISLALFYYKFVVYDPVIYMLGVILLVASFSILTYILLKLINTKAPLKKAIITGVAAGIAIFAVMGLVHSVILKNQYPYEVAGYMTVFLAAVLITICTVISIKAKSEGIMKAVIITLCVILILPTGIFAVKNMLPVSYEHPFEDKSIETKGLDNVSDKNRLIVNADDSHWWSFWNELARNGNTDEVSLNAYVMQYADTDVTDLLFNIFCQSSDTPSEIFTFRGDLYGKTEQNSKPVDYSNYYGLNEFFNNKNIDIFAVWIEKCRKVGINPWISLRMNDCHDPDAETSQLRGDIFYTAVENGWTIGEEYGYYRYCLNYKVPEIRQMMLQYTKEQLLRYDVYGIELDFMREIYCFDYINESTEEITEIMTQYMRDTADIVKEAEQKWGHDIKLSVRLMRDLDQCREYGFDVIGWNNEKLIDSVTVTPRFTSNDSGMPISDWKQRCPDIEIYAGIETLVNTQSKACHASAEVVRGYSAQYLTEGADGIYLFNFMSAGTVNSRNGEVYNTCGSLSEIIGHSRRHIVTYQDTAPEGYEPYKPLPLKIKSGNTQELKVTVGYIPENKKLSVYIGVKKELTADSLSLAINGRSCIYEGISEVYGESERDFSPVLQGYCSEDCIIYKFSLTDSSDLPNTLTLTFTNNGKTAEISYAEITVL